MKSFINLNLLRKVILIFTLVIILSNIFNIDIFAISNISSDATIDSSTDVIMSSSRSRDIPATFSPACILMDQISGKILYNKNANSKMYPASTTKIMTAILAIENCELTDIATASHNSVFSIPYGYSHASIREGEELTIEQLLNVLLIPSANDAAVVLAEHIAGSVESFSDMMNLKALELGCLNTHFVNPNGIHDENHYSTAYDLALMGKYAMQFDIFRNIVSKTYYALPKTNKYDKDDRLFNTTNDLIKKTSKTSLSNYYEYATGAKTGYTDPAKSCIVATATKGDMSLIAVVMHSETMDDGTSQRAIDCKALFEYGFNNFTIKQIASKGETAHELTVKGATQDTAKLNLLYSEDIFALIPNDYDLSSLDKNIKLTENITAPISENTNLGTITINIDNIDYSTSLISSHTVYKSDFNKTLMELILLIIFLVLISKFLKFKNNKNKSKLRKRNKKKKSSKAYINNFYPKYK